MANLSVLPQLHQELWLKILVCAIYQDLCIFIRIFLALVQSGLPPSEVARESRADTIGGLRTPEHGHRELSQF